MHTGDMGGDSAREKLAERRLEERAVREGWHIPHEYRVRILQRLIDVVRAGDEAGPRRRRAIRRPSRSYFRGRSSGRAGDEAGPRQVLGAARALIGADLRQQQLDLQREQLDIQRERLELARDQLDGARAGALDPAVIRAEAERLEAERLAERARDGDGPHDPALHG